MIGGLIDGRSDPVIPEDAEDRPDVPQPGELPTLTAGSDVFTVATGPER